MKVIVKLLKWNQRKGLSFVRKPCYFFISFCKHYFPQKKAERPAHNVYNFILQKLLFCNVYLMLRFLFIYFTDTEEWSQVSYMPTRVTTIWLYYVRYGAQIRYIWVLADYKRKKKKIK